MDHNSPSANVQQFLAITDPELALALVAEAPGELLSDDTLTELDRLLAAESDEGRRAFLTERRELLQNLHTLRQQFGELQEQLAELPEAERQFLAFMAIPNSLGMAALVANSDDAALDALQATAVGKLAETNDEEVAGIQARLNDLDDLRAAGREAVQDRLDTAQAAANRLGEDLIAWIQTPDWGASEQYLRQHAADLLSEDGDRALELLQLASPGNDQIPMHRQLLQFAREQGIEVAYAQLQQELADAQGLTEAARQMADNPLLQAIAEFITIEGDEAARNLLDSRRDLLLTTDARGLLEQFLQAARQQGDVGVVERLEKRLALWSEAWRGQVGAPLRHRDQEPWQAQPESERVDRLERQPLAGERGAQYTVVTAVNSAIGDNAQVLNIYDVGDLPLAWGHPRETKPDLAAIAVGRTIELDDLHRRLQTGDVALVGVRGLAGVGKTVLTAMYATRYADEYPGGVIWVTVGPQVRRHNDAPPDVTPLLQRLAAYAYNRDLRVAWLDQVVFAPDAVQMLLGNHGRLLLVFDDVWSDEAVIALRSAAPPGSAVLLTTRDRRVAYALGGPDATQELDVLSEADARALLQRRAPSLSDELADRVAAKLGRHAQALALAGAALHLRKPHRYAATAAEILDRVARGVGFGDLPDLDQADKETNVEIALKYTYDYLGEDRLHGRQWQAGLRSLGVFAQEASFDSEAAASLWQTSPGAAEDLLLLFDHLALIQETETGGRWQQHAILRAYALSLLDGEERLALQERHAAYYVNLARVCYQARPRDNERIEREFQQIEHAFAWCLSLNPTRAVALYEALSDYMINRGRSGQAVQWAEAALAGADRVGARLGKANTLKSLGDLESRLGNIDQARGHYDAALPLYEAEQARLGKANTLKSLGDLESRLGNIDQARGHYDAALPLYEAEQDRLGKANTLQSLGDLESRLGNIDQARGHYDAALPLYEAEQARLGKANTLQSLGDLESRLGNIDQARGHYDAALPLYEAEQDRLGKANTLKSLGDLESRLGNIDQARGHYDAALPLYEAEQDRLGKANTLKSLGDLESRLGNIDQARGHYDAALPLYEAEQDRLGKANTLQSLGDLESRLGNIDQARGHYDAALPLYEAEQARLGKANTLKSLGDLESRLGNIDQARGHYDAALPLYEAEQARLGKANTLKSLGDLESRLGNIDQARGHYDAALPLYEAEQDRLGKANTLQSLGDLESRLGNIDQARGHYDAALPLYEAEQDRLGKANTLKSLGDLESRLGNIDQARGHYDAALPLYEAEQARLGKANTLKSLGDLESRLGNIDQARGHYDAALELYLQEQEPGGIINTLVSRARLEASTGNLEQAVPLFEQAFHVADQTGFANHPVVQDMRREYEALQGLADTATDRLAVAVSALLRVDSDQALAQTLAEHPVLAETEALFALAGLVNQALAAQQNQDAARLVVFLVLLVERYNQAHYEQIDPQRHAAVIDLCEGTIPLAGQIDAGLTNALRQQAARACNTLGNHYANEGQSRDLEQALVAYSRGHALDPSNAMLLRNRAGVHLDRQDRAAAQADIDAAASLEPDAPRLAELRKQLEEL